MLPSRQLCVKYQAQANILVVDERQQFESLTRDEKIINHTCAQLTEKRPSFKEKITTRNEGLRTQTGKRVEIAQLL